MMACASLPIRQFLRTAALEARSLTGEGQLFLLDYLLRLVRVVLLLSLWRVILTGRGTVSGMNLSSVLTYTLASEMFGQALNPSTDAEWNLWEGSIVNRLLQPMGLFQQYTAQFVGRWSPGILLFTIPLLLLAPLLGVNPLPASVENGAAFCVSLILAVSVGLALEFVYAGLMLLMCVNIYAMGGVRAALSVLLSGSLIPLALLPWRLGAVFSWLPFASVASAPLRIYTGTGPIGTLLAGQVAWLIVLWPLANAVWRRGREKMVSPGG